MYFCISCLFPNDYVIKKKRKSNTFVFLNALSNKRSGDGAGKPQLFLRHRSFWEPCSFQMKRRRRRVTFRVTFTVAPAQQTTMKVYQPVPVQKIMTLKLKQLNRIQPCCFLIFTPALFSCCSVSK